MKKLLFISTVILLSSCTQIFYPRLYKEQVGYCDLQTYAKEGFFISPGNYNSTFEPIGLIEINVYPADTVLGAKAKGKEVKGYPGISVRNDISGYAIEGKSMQLGRISYDELLRKVVSIAKEKGANGLINFEIKDVIETSFIERIRIEKLDHYHVTGFAIKR